MRYVLLKASDDNYIRLIENSIDKICSDYGALIVEENFGYKDPDYFKTVFGVNEKEAKEYAKCKIEIIIYDDYVE